MLLLEATRLGLEFIDRKSGRVVDPDRGLGELPGHLHQLGEIRLREKPAAQLLHLHFRARTEKTLHERLRSHFQTEDGAGDGVVLPDRNVLDDVHDEGGLAHRRARRHDDHFPAVEAVRHRVEVVKAGHEPAALALAVVHVLDRLDHLDDVHTHLLDALLIFSLVPDLEDPLFHRVEEIRRTLGTVIGLSDTLRAILDDASEDEFLLQETRVVLKECRRRNIIEKICQGLGPAHGVELALVREFGVEDDEIELALGTRLVEMQERLEDDAVGRDVEVAGRELFDRLWDDRDRIHQHARKRGALGIGIDRHGAQRILGRGALLEGLASLAFRPSRTTFQGIAATTGKTGIGHGIGNR